MSDRIKLLKHELVYRDIVLLEGEMFHCRERELEELYERYEKGRFGLGGEAESEIETKEAERSRLPY